MQPPYSGYTWHFSQHAVALEPKNLFSLLRAAYFYQGKAGVSREISQSLADWGILTKNVRRDSNVPDPWRDYQQILAELGLIVSTTVSQSLLVTPVGMLLLDGSIGVGETLTNQALRYQYSNGFKWDISSRLRSEISRESERADNLAELQARKGVLVKPAILLLRFMIELISEERDPTISIDECQGFVLPIGKNSEWEIGYRELVRHRDSVSGFIKFGVRRNVQDWFAFLARTDIFERAGRSTLRLSSMALGSIEMLRDICEAEEAPESFWVPSNYSLQERLSWFMHYGAYDIQSQWIASKIDNKYIEKNYVDGKDEEVEEAEEDFEVLPSGQISLKDFSGRDMADRGRRLPGLPRNYWSGAERSEKNSRLHEHIVGEVARTLSEKDFTVQSSVGGREESVDLLVRKGEAVTILEIKTMTRRNWRSRFRLGIGQLSEYRYRFERQEGLRPNALLVISTRPSFPTWLTSFLQEDVKIGLSGYSPQGFLRYTNCNIEEMLAQ